MQFTLAPFVGRGHDPADAVMVLSGIIFMLRSNMLRRLFLGYILDLIGGVMTPPYEGTYGTHM